MTPASGAVPASAGFLSMLYAVLALVLAAAALCFYLLSGKTLEGDSAGGATSRERVKMARKNSTRELDFEKVAAECKASGDEWKDGSFGHDGFGASIGDVELKESERGKKLELDSSVRIRTCEGRAMRACAVVGRQLAGGGWLWIGKRVAPCVSAPREPPPGRA